MEPQCKQQFSLTASVTWQNGVLLRMATALSRKGFEVVFFQRKGLAPCCTLILVIEGFSQHLPHALVVLQQLIDVAAIFLSEKQAICEDTKYHGQKIAPVAQ